MSKLQPLVQTHVVTERTIPYNYVILAGFKILMTETFFFLENTKTLD